MAKIFISYSRKDEAFARQLAQTLSDAGVDIWIDVDDIPPGMNWSSAIHQGLDTCEVMLLVLSPDAMASHNVEAEWQYFIDQKKPLIPLWFRPTKVHFQIHRLQYINFHDQDFDTAFRQLRTALRDAHVPLNNTTPSDDDASLTIPLQPTLPTETDQLKQPFAQTAIGQLTIGLIITIIGGLILAFLLGQWPNNGTATVADAATPSPSQTASVTQTTPSPAIVTTNAPSDTPTVAPSHTPTDTPSHTPTDTLSDTPTDAPSDTPTDAPSHTPTEPISPARQTATAFFATQNAFASQTATALAPTQTQAAAWTQTAQAHIEATQTATAIIMELATLITHTPTPNMTQTRNAALTQVAAQATATRQAQIDDAYQRARNFQDVDSATNGDWQAFEQVFNGHPMMLVPTGCFEMGNDPNAQFYDGSRWVTGVPDGGTQCFEIPFWIDRYEVTNAQFARFLNENANGNRDPDANVEYLDDDDSDVNIRLVNGVWQADVDYADHPVVEVTWFGARAYCDWREARLPREDEWEYAARGVDEWVYPWGNSFEAQRVNASGSSDGYSGTAPVDAFASGASWVGAEQLSGNIWEWVSSAADGYPYDETDGREGNVNSTNVRRALRGGSWLYLDTVVRAANRNGFNPVNANLNVGFRCSRSF